MRLILASASPRRRELLERAGLSFEVVPAMVEESFAEDDPPVPTARRLAVQKAAEVASRHPDAVVIGADTIVVVEGRILGQPSDAAGAREMLRTLSGREHQVITGYAVIAGEQRAEDAVTTRVRFRELSDEEIDAYVATGEPLDKSGSYAIQGGASGFVETIEGDVSNVVGLPIPALLRTLSRFGIAP